MPGPSEPSPVPEPPAVPEAPAVVERPQVEETPITGYEGPGGILVPRQTKVSEQWGETVLLQGQMATDKLATFYKTNGYEVVSHEFGLTMTAPDGKGLVQVIRGIGNEVEILVIPELSSPTPVDLPPEAPPDPQKAEEIRARLKAGDTNIKDLLGPQ